MNYIRLDIFPARARSDPSLAAGVRGDPQWISALRIDPPERFGSRGHPPEVRYTRNGPPAACPLPESSGKEYCSDRHKRIGHKDYPLPSALADANLPKLSFRKQPRAESRMNEHPTESIALQRQHFHNRTVNDLRKYIPVTTSA